ncbi:alpha/beta-hydrolase [Cystobasidium minutum MCA 4210]|uniref:alpha/beta-hydrolase n=1 Tax=Cystobasidium minutum MCA 4210 TaxID=1397322 RepID=UPI0034CFE771|eukprot:jgi/Rhomi1/192311/gm1.525_g
MASTEDVRKYGQDIMASAMKTFKGVLPSYALAAKLAAGAFIAFGGALYFGQRYIIYPAYAPAGSRQQVDTPDKHKMPKFEDLTLESPEKLKIKAYLILQGAGLSGEAADDEVKKRPTVLFLHAIAGNMGHRLPFAHIFYEKLKCNVFMLSYRGYGLSEGSPSEAGMRSDAQLALDYIKSHPLLENTKVILYGQSIGGAVSVDLAATNPDRIAGVILENTFLNLAKIATASMPIAAPYIWLGLLKDTWDSASRIATFRKDMPTLFLSGSMDEIVPPPQFLQLFELCASDRKRLRKFPYGTHNDTCVAPGYWPEIAKWMQEELGLGSLTSTEKPTKSNTYDEKRMEGAEDELRGTMGAGSIAP